MSIWRFWYGTCNCFASVVNTAGINTAGTVTPDELLAAVRNGLRGLGSLLGRYRDRLKWRAREAASPRLQVRSSPSDIVQDTMLHACRDFPQFQGTSENELWAWLKRILARRVLGAVRRHVGSHKRDLRREVSIEQFRPASDRSSVNLGERMAAAQSTPSGFICATKSFT